MHACASLGLLLLLLLLLLLMMMMMMTTRGGVDATVEAKRAVATALWGFKMKRIGCCQVMAMVMAMVMVMPIMMVTMLMLCWNACFVTTTTIISIINNQQAPALTITNATS